MGVHGLAGLNHLAHWRRGCRKASGERVKVVQEVQEAHRRGPTDPPQQPGPAHLSGTHRSFPAAVRAGLHHARALDARVWPRDRLGRLWGSQGRAWRRWEEGL